MDYTRLFQEAEKKNPRNIFSQFVIDTNIIPEYAEVGATSPVLWKELETLGRPNFMQVYYYDPKEDISYFQNVYGESLADFILHANTKELAAIIYQVVVISDIMFKQLNLIHADLHHDNIRVIKVADPVIIPCTHAYSIEYIPVFIDYDDMNYTDDSEEAADNLYTTFDTLHNHLIDESREKELYIPEDFFTPILDLYTPEVTYQEYYDSILEYLCSVINT